MPKKIRPALKPDLAQTAIERHQSLQRPARNFAALGDFLEDALVNQVEKLRNHGENRDLTFVERAQQFRRVQRFQINDAGALYQRQQKIRHLGEHVKERQHPEHGVFRDRRAPI